MPSARVFNLLRSHPGRLVMIESTPSARNRVAERGASTVQTWSSIRAARSAWTKAASTAAVGLAGEAVDPGPFQGSKNLPDARFPVAAQPISLVVGDPETLVAGEQLPARGDEFFIEGKDGCLLRFEAGLGQDGRQGEQDFRAALQFDEELFPGRDSGDDLPEGGNPLAGPVCPFPPAHVKRA